MSILTTDLQSSTHHHCIDRAFAQLKDGDKFEPVGSGKIFTKMAGVLVAPDLESYTWIKSKTSSEFFNKYVVRIMYSSHHNLTPLAAP